MRRLIPAFLGYALLLSACDQKEHKRYLPLSEARVTIPDSKIDAMEYRLVAFAKANNLHVDEGNFPRVERRVLSLSMNVGSDGMFFATNFRFMNRVDITAYSHDARSVWREKWLALIQDLRANFGSVNVVDRDVQTTDDQP